MLPHCNLTTGEVISHRHIFFYKVFVFMVISLSSHLYILTKEIELPHLPQWWS